MQLKTGYKLTVPKRKMFWAFLLLAQIVLLTFFTYIYTNTSGVSRLVSFLSSRYSKNRWLRAECFLLSFSFDSPKGCSAFRIWIRLEQLRAGSQSFVPRLTRVSFPSRIRNPWFCSVQVNKILHVQTKKKYENNKLTSKRDNNHCEVEKPPSS